MIVLKNKKNIKIKIGINKLKLFLFFLMGLTSTWTALQIPLAGIQISIYNVIALLIIMLQVMTKGINKKFTEVIPILFFLSTIVSALVAVMYLESFWVKESIKATVKFVIVFMPFFLVFDRQSLKKVSDRFFKGLFYSCVIQLIWSFIQLFFWYGFNRVINQEIFGDLMHIKINHSWLTWHNGFRTTGIAWESANLGMCMIVGFFMTDKKWLKVLFFIGLFFTGSRTGIFALALSIFIDYFIIQRKYNKWHIKTAYKMTTLISFIIAFPFVIFFVSKLNIDFSIIADTLSSFVERIVRTFNKTDASANRHIDYYFKIYEVWKNSHPIQLIFGYGTSCSGYPYNPIYYESYDISNVWNVESDVITLLIGNGIAGFVLYYAWLGKILVSVYKKHNYRELKIIMAIVFAGIMYLYLRTWITLILIFYVMNIYQSSDYGDNLFNFKIMRRIKCKI